jgi:hypothetical protein
MKIILSGTATAALIISASVGFAANNQQSGRNTEERKNGSIVSADFDHAKKCVTGKHFASVDIKSRTTSGDAEMKCDAALVESEMYMCMTGPSDWSWITHQGGAMYSSSIITYGNDAISSDRVTTSNADSNLGRPVGQPNSAGLGTHIRLCDALQKATVAINANPDAMATLHQGAGKVSVQDFHLVRQMLIDNGVPAEMLGEQSDISRVKVNFHWDVAHNVKAREMQDMQPVPLQVSVDWDQKTNIKVLM